jgi:hypothetical protein
LWHIEVQDENHTIPCSLKGHAGAFGGARSLGHVPQIHLPQKFMYHNFVAHEAHVPQNQSHVPQN